MREAAGKGELISYFSLTGVAIKHDASVMTFLGSQRIELFANYHSYLSKFWGGGL